MLTVFKSQSFEVAISTLHGRTGLDVTLTHTPTGKKKVFYLAAHRPETAYAVTAHFYNMTEELMLQWFEKQGGKKKKKGKKDGEAEAS